MTDYLAITRTLAQARKQLETGCTATSPSGLTCNWGEDHPGRHVHEFGPGAVVTWDDNAPTPLHRHWDPDGIESDMAAAADGYNPHWPHPTRTSL